MIDLNDYINGRTFLPITIGALILIKIVYWLFTRKRKKLQRLHEQKEKELLPLNGDTESKASAKIQAKKVIKLRKKKALPAQSEPKDIDTREIQKVENVKWLDAQANNHWSFFGMKIPKPRLKLPRLTFKSIEDEVKALSEEELIEIRGEIIEGLEPTKIETPILLLMRTNGDLDTFFGVPDGMFRIERKGTGDEEEQEAKGIVLRNSKLHNWKYAGENIKTWIAYEDEATAYPREVTHDSSMLVKIIEKMRLNFQGLIEPKGGLPKWIDWALKIGVGVAIVAVLAWKFGFLDMFTAHQAAQTATEAVSSNASLAAESAKNVITID